MSEVAIRTSICCVIFVDIVDYSKATIEGQVKMKELLNAAIHNGLSHTQEDELIILDSGDGAAICVFGDPEDALFAASAIAGDLQGSLRLRTGINLGPVKIVTDLTGKRNVIGDAINVAQRIMSFAGEGEVLISRSYFEVVSCLRDDNRFQFSPLGKRKDKHIREHEVYAVAAAADATLSFDTTDIETTDFDVEIPDEIAPEFQDECAAHLAQSIGPMAGVIVRKAAKDASSSRELIEVLADKIDTPVDRKLFLQQMTTKLSAQPSGVEGTTEFVPDANAMNDHGHVEIDDALVEKATKFLASRIGPIAKALTIKASQNSGSVSGFLSTLAAHMDDETDKQNFLDHMSS